MQKRFIALFTLFFVVLPVAVAAQSNEEPLVLSLNKDFGYAAAGQMQGIFSLRVRSPDDLVRVDFYIDGHLVHSSLQPPFQFKFNTADFELGEHTFYAEGFRLDHSVVASSEFSREFIGADAAWNNVGKLIMPVFVVIGVMTLLGISGGFFLTRNKDFVLSEYGIAGGVVCPRCTFPYPRNILAPNLAVGKLQRCPHCGKWAIVPRASARDLEAAEERYRAQSMDEVSLSDQSENYNKLLDDSRFDS